MTHRAPDGRKFPWWRLGLLAIVIIIGVLAAFRYGSAQHDVAPQKPHVTISAPTHPTPPHHPTPAPKSPQRASQSSRQTYTVQKGDTLWHIAMTHLGLGQRWTLLWHMNPQIHNPNLIYPGQVLLL